MSHNDLHGLYAYGLWSSVLFNVIVYLLFAGAFIMPRRKVEWRSFGAFFGFLVALFTEMYGLPLTIYLLSTWLGSSYPALNPFTHVNGHLLLVFLGLADSPSAMSMLHLISFGMVFFGFIIIILGWIMIFRFGRKRLVTWGIYALMRHPQYTGLFLITTGLLLQWPSITALVMWPVLMLAYYRLAKREESVLDEKFGEEFWEYRRKVPAFVPFFFRMPKEKEVTNE